jgi:hypothetical protein
MYFSKPEWDYQDRTDNLSSVCRCLVQLFTEAGGFNASTGLHRNGTAVEIVYERSWIHGHVPFKAETARNTHVEYVAATTDAVVHAHAGLLGRSSSYTCCLIPVNTAAGGVVARFPLFQVQNLYPIEST